MLPPAIRDSSDTDGDGKMVTTLTHHLMVRILTEMVVPERRIRDPDTDEDLVSETTRFRDDDVGWCVDDGVDAPRFGRRLTHGGFSSIVVLYTLTTL